MIGADDSNGVRNPSGIWINTSYFSESARHFQEHGYYTASPTGSPDWVYFWETELDRCINGYSVGGAKITGHHYFYLNYCQIKRLVTKSGKHGRKGVTFPDFWDGDYNFFWSFEIARNGISEQGLKDLQLSVTPLFLDGGKHLIAVKRRRAGFSLKTAAMAANTFNTERNSTTILGAYSREFLYPNGIMTMASNNLDFLNEHTGWTKKREFVDKISHKEAAYAEFINGVPVKRGYKSQIIALTFKDNPDAARGKDITLLVLDEGGAFDRLIDSVAATMPALRDGDVTTGTGIILGTGAYMSAGAVDFQKMYYEPDSYGMLPFENIWDEDVGQGAKCGFLWPAYQNLQPYIDDQGNSHVDKAKAAEIENRESVKKASLTAYNQYIVEWAWSGQEAFLAGSKNTLPVEAIKRQLNKLRADDYFKKKGQVVELSRTNGKVIAKPDLSGKISQITDYPTKQKDVTGAVVIWEWPVENPPAGLYKIGFDPYRQNSSVTDSLGACYVYKGLNDFSFNGDLLVAEYVGRPETYDEAYRMVDMLSELYNAEIMFENEVTSIVDHFRHIKKLHKLALQPDKVISTSVKNSQVARTYGIHMVARIKEAGIQYLKKWLLTERNFDENGNVMLNIEKIYSIPLLEEMLAYNPDPNARVNTDRLMALLMVMFAIKDDELRDVGYKKEPAHKASTLELEEMIKTKYKKRTGVAGYFA